MTTSYMMRIVINILTNHVINDSCRVDSSDFLIDQPFPIDKWINLWHKLRSKYFLSLTESVITFFKANFKKSINHLTWTRSFPFEQLFSWSIFIILSSFKKITQNIWKINYFSPDQNFRQFLEILISNSIILESVI